MTVSTRFCRVGVNFSQALSGLPVKPLAFHLSDPEEDDVWWASVDVATRPCSSSRARIDPMRRVPSHDSKRSVIAGFVVLEVMYRQDEHVS